jgi:peptide/nickel transport system substrate-binding protein
MRRQLHVIIAAGAILSALAPAEPANAQKQGGVMKMGHFDSPASMSPLEESTIAVNRPMSGVFNNLVMYKQDVAQNSPQSIIPDLATGWSWNEEGTELTFPLRQGVKWHDGKPFTAADVKCTFDLLMGKSSDQLRVNPRKSWYLNVAEVTTNGDYETTFHLKRRATCAAIRSVLAHSSSSSSSRTSRSQSPAIRIIGKKGGPISTASNTRSSKMYRPGC